MTVLSRKGFIKVKQKGNFNNVERFMNRVLKRDYLNILDQYGQQGVAILAANTPTDSGKTAASWEYGIERGHGKTTIYWYNTNENNGSNIAILLIYGHATQNGSYVEGFDFANPAMKPLFEEMASRVWNEVTE